MTAASKATVVIGFSTRRSDLFRHHAWSTAVPGDLLSLGLRRNRQRFIVTAAPPHGPGDASELVGQSDRSLVVPTPSLELQSPGTKAIVLLGLLGVAQHRAGTVDQQHAEVGVAAFGDATETLAQAARVFAGCQPKVAREMSARGKARHVAHESH
jgi:hypothetical protein